MRILIVKTSSLGDVIHTLPALTDAANALPGLTVDWVVEEAFAEVPAWHPVVNKVIPVAIRRWRRDWAVSWRSGELAAFRRNLRAYQYDAVIDAQGLIKSALLTWQARGHRIGLDKSSLKEPLSRFFYQQKVAVSKGQHAVQRVRQLFAAALNYSFDRDRVDYGLAAGSWPVIDLPPRTLLFLHGTTWDSKHWPLPYWQQLARLAADAGYHVVLPWGSLQEQARAREIAGEMSHVQVLSQLTLTELSAVVAHCQGVVAVDTGLGHLAAALNKATVSLYGATNPELSGTFGHHQLHLTADLPCAPCLRRECAYRGEPMVDQAVDGTQFFVVPACYRVMAPRDVMGHLLRLIADSPRLAPEYQ